MELFERGQIRKSVEIESRKVGGVWVGKGWRGRLWVERRGEIRGAIVIKLSVQSKNARSVVSAEGHTSFLH